MSCNVVPKTPLMKWRDTEETLRNPHVFLIKKKGEEGAHISVHRDKKTGNFKIKKKPAQTC